MDSNQSKIYNWIRNIINSCDHPLHIDPCEALINHFEKKGAEEYQIKALKESLKIQVNEIAKRSKQQADPDLEKKIGEMFKSGEYTIPQMKDELHISYFKCREILNKIMKKQHEQKNQKNK